MNIDFIALEREMWAATAGNVSDPLPAIAWCTDYVPAIARAIVANDYAPLLRLLDAGEPMHPMLAPALAEAMRLRGRPGKAGRKRRLTSIEARNVAAAVLALRHQRVSEAEAISRVADSYGIGEAVARRAFQEHVPVYRRPGWKLGVTPQS